MVYQLLESDVEMRQQVVCLLVMIVRQLQRRDLVDFHRLADEMSEPDVDVLAVRQRHRSGAPWRPSCSEQTTTSQNAAIHRDSTCRTVNEIDELNGASMLTVRANVLDSGTPSQGHENHAAQKKDDINDVEVPSSPESPPGYFMFERKDGRFALAVMSWEEVVRYDLLRCNDGSRWPMPPARHLPLTDEQMRRIPAEHRDGFVPVLLQMRGWRIPPDVLQRLLLQAAETRQRSAAERSAEKKKRDRDDDVQSPVDNSAATLQDSNPSDFVSIVDETDVSSAEAFQRLAEERSERSAAENMTRNETRREQQRDNDDDKKNKTSVENYEAMAAAHEAAQINQLTCSDRPDEPELNARLAADNEADDQTRGTANNDESPRRLVVETELSVVQPLTGQMEVEVRRVVPLPQQELQQQDESSESDRNNGHLKTQMNVDEEDDDDDIEISSIDIPSDDSQPTSLTTVSSLVVEDVQRVPDENGKTADSSAAHSPLEADPSPAQELDTVEPQHMVAATQRQEETNPSAAETVERDDDQLEESIEDDEDAKSIDILNDDSPTSMLTLEPERVPDETPGDRQPTTPPGEGGCLDGTLTGTGVELVSTDGHVEDEPSSHEAAE